MKGYNANKILKHAERALLNERIRQNNVKIKLLESKQNEIKDKLRGELPDPELDKVCEFTATAQLGEHHKCKQRQIWKFAALKETAENVIFSPEWMSNSSKNTNFNKDKWVVNLSSYVC